MAEQIPLILKSGHLEQLPSTDRVALAALPEMVGGTLEASGLAGIVPAPPVGGPAKFLRGDKTWSNLTPLADPTKTIFTNVTSGDILKYDGTTWRNAVDTGGASAHADLTGLQGGTTGQYYHLTSTELTKLTGIEALADVTDAANVDAAGAVMNTDYNAKTILAAVSDNTPSAITIGNGQSIRLNAGGTTFIAYHPAGLSLALSSF